MVLALARPWRHPRTGTYWFRRRVPKDLQFLLGRSEERKSLGTKEPTEARMRFLQHLLEVEERWARLRQGEAALAARPDAPPSHRPSHCGWPGREIAVPSTPLEVAAGRSDADASVEAVPWRPTFDGYAAESKLAPATIKRWTGILSALEARMGTDDLAVVGRSDLLAWKAELLASGKDPRTVRDAYFAATKAVLGWAFENGRLATNPAVGIVVKVPDKARTRDRDLTDREAQLILAATFEPQDPRLAQTHADARRWVPWLCAYTGARVNEMTQLRAEDVRCEDGIWLVRITPEAGRVKTGRWRDVPIHPHLLDQSFIEFVVRRRGKPLFYAPERTRIGTAANPPYKKVGERLAAWVRSIGVTDPEVDPNHGWRHRFKTVGRRAGIEPAILDAIQGHAPRTEGEHYGRYPVDVLSAAINRMPRYPVPVGPSLHGRPG